ncbi:hypothetical protein H9P43_004476 [Blastocladiella emersonii ATCC 22665]|nr:hypothetical protein H9P43_004476 [Blastocladiella emersonii ATCC 22665]
MSEKRKKKKAEKEETGGETVKGGGPAADPVLVEMYELRIKDLAEKIDKAKEKQRALQAENETLLKAQTKSVSEKQDIVEFLRIELANHERTLAETEDALHALEQEKQFLMRTHAEELSVKEHHMDEEREALQQKVSKLSADLADLAEFRGRKDAMERDLASLVTELERKERDFRTETTAMERKFLQDKHLLKREMVGKVTEAVASFRRVADTQIAETTKRAIRENLLATAQLRKMATKTSELLAENEALKDANRRLRIDAEILRDGQAQLARKNAGAYHLIRRLLAKLEAARVPLDRDDHKLIRGTVPPLDPSEVRGGREAGGGYVPLTGGSGVTGSRPQTSGSTPHSTMGLAGGGGAPGGETFMALSPPGSPSRRAPPHGGSNPTGPSTTTTAASPGQVRHLQAQLNRAETVAEQLHGVVADLADHLHRVYPAVSSPARHHHHHGSKSPNRRHPHPHAQAPAAAEPLTAVVPPVVRRFVQDLRSQRAFVSLHLPRPPSPVPGSGAAQQAGEFGGLTPAGAAARSPPAATAGSLGALAGPVVLGAAQVDAAGTNAMALSTRKHVNLELLLSHLPQLPGSGTSLKGGGAGGGGPGAGSATAVGST